MARMVSTISARPRTAPVVAWSGSRIWSLSSPDARSHEVTPASTLARTTRSAAGAGRPTVLELPNGLAQGVRTASDFLMALQLTGAFKEEALANLQAELPAVVIGGGLTAIDTATELLAYYPIQVEKTLARYEALIAERGEQAVRGLFDEEEREILDRLLRHGGEVRGERERARIAEYADAGGCARGDDVTRQKGHRT